ncbi:hypothetical protein [Allonocardiopsis opalescens]|uniref:Uncharacterized protein n=1 Tax=Allonocardiopsis opalescens TaxID=1144618 RepID=A0A2T0Q6X1_9ACTN|nr:hypothetical protein [Allonocardiopsis opalescens]PRX99531.1 hypothetical protein CLV72_103132 [Allonocardiopsis opalescens]
MDDTVRFHLAGQVEQARERLDRVLTGQGFQVRWDSPVQGTAEKGSAVKAAFLGVFALHYPYLIRLERHGEAVHVTMMVGPSGMAGGVVGQTRVRAKLAELRELLTRS